MNALYPSFNFPAIRALRGALNRDEHLKAQEEGARADRQFDGGEWSDAWHAQTFQDITTAIAWRVAARFQMNGDDLLYQMQVAEHVELDYVVAAISRKVHDALIAKMLENPLVRRMS